MSTYQVKKTNGSMLCEISENSVNITSTSLSLIGQGTMDYGSEEAHNLVGLLENFANTVAPKTPLSGQIWYDTGSLPYVLKLWDGKIWNDVGSALGQSNLPNGGATVGGNTGGAIRSSGTVGAVLVNGLAKTSIVVIVSEGKIIAVLCNEHIPFSSLPKTIVLNGLQFDFASMFPDGIFEGQTLAHDFFGYGIFKQSRDPIASDEAATKHYLDIIDTRITSLSPHLVPHGLIAMWGGSADGIPFSWVICNGQNGTPDLRDHFIKGGNPNQSGGSSTASSTTSLSGSHAHSGQTTFGGEHTHGNTGGHSVNNDEMTSHSHTIIINQDWREGQASQFGSIPMYTGLNGSTIFESTPDGGNAPHAHSINPSGHIHPVTTDGSIEHTHDVSFDTIPSYYSLYYIMKV